MTPGEAKPTVGAGHSSVAGGASLDHSLKSREVEEAIDLYFYRPLGFVIARGLCRTSILPNHVTFVSIVLGVAAGHLLFYNQVRVTLVGILAFVVANLLDSVDGQLARLKSLESHVGRILDGVAGASMFTSIYLHLSLRQYSGGDGIPAFAVALLALYSQAVQNSIADCLLNAYLTYGARKRGYELHEAGEIRRRAEQSPNLALRLGLRLYGNYTATQERLTPALQRFRRAVTTHLTDDGWERVSAAYRRLNRPIVQQRAWIATNIRMALLFAAVLTDRVGWYFWFNIIVLNLVMAVLIALHERHCRTLTRCILGEHSSQAGRSARRG